MYLGCKDLSVHTCVFQVSQCGVGLLLGGEEWRDWPGESFFLNPHILVLNPIP